MDSNKMKVAITAIILLAGGILTVIAGTPTPSSPINSTGTIIDFDDYETEWTELNPADFEDPLSMLKYACEKKSLPLVIDDNTGKVKSIRGVTSTDSESWELWAVKKNTTEWMMIPAPYTSVDLSGYSVTSWSYRGADERPTVAVDFTGCCIYGFGVANRIVSLSPSITEITASVGATKSIVGTDFYSNYPEEIVTMQRSGDIAIVGDFTTPVYEDVMKTNPSMTLCDGSQYNHIKTAEKLRNNGKNAVVTYPGESLSAIFDNIFIIGMSTGYDISAKAKIQSLIEPISQMELVLETSYEAKKIDTMLTLTVTKSPYISGNYTYLADSLERMYGVNVFGEYDSWAHINSELVLKKNPAAIIVVSTDYRATQQDYDNMINSMSMEWRGTDAYKNGRIYLLCDEAGDLTQRPGPRASQITELIGRLLNPEVFDDIELPKFIGDNYEDYISYTK